MNIFHIATKKLEEKNKNITSVFRISGSIQELNGIKSLYGIDREIEEDIRGGYFIRLPYEIGDILDEAITIRNNLDEGGK